MVWSSEVPDGLDADTARRVARTFLVVRMVRGGLLLLFLGVVLVAVELEGWPGVVAVVVAALLLLQAARLVSAWRRYDRLRDGARRAR